MSANAFFYAAVGARLTTHRLDTETGALLRASTREAAAPVQYAWRHPTRAILYVAASDGGPGVDGSCHRLQAFAIDASNGALEPLGEVRRLEARPIHCTVDPTGGYVLVAYNRPSGVSLHRIEADGGVGPCVDADWDVGIYAHQVRLTPSGKTVIVVTRGNDATAERPEEPGSLVPFRIGDDTLIRLDPIIPGEAGGLGFGPRHLDFHAQLGWVVVSVERQDELHVYPLGEDDLPSSTPLHVLDSLLPQTRAAAAGPQLACAVHVHPNRRWIYQANRTDRLTRSDGWPVAHGGEDSLVVYSLDDCLQDPAKGPRIIQRVVPPTIHVRTFSIHPDGRWLVAASIQPVPVAREQGGVELVPAALCVYRIDDRGLLTLARTYQVNTAGALMFWTGMVSVSGAGTT